MVFYDSTPNMKFFEITFGEEFELINTAFNMYNNHAYILVK